MSRRNQCVLVTGAAGFVGTNLGMNLRSRGFAVRRGIRAVQHLGPNDVAIGPGIDWRAVVENVDCVIHLAARAHVMRERSSEALAEYRRTNVALTSGLAEAAAQAGVRRFVFMSSIKVNGESTTDRPFSEKDVPRPEDAYGITKWEAEQALWQIAGGRELEVVVLRPPLVYGPGVKGNFLSLMRLVASGWPLPFASIQNSRSFIYLGNLIDAIIACVDAPAAARKTYLVSDGEDISTPNLIRALAASLDVPPRLISCPITLLKVGADLLGKSAEMTRLAGSLQVDSSRIRDELGWRPRFTLAEGLVETAKWFKSRDSVIQ